MSKKMASSFLRATSATYADWHKKGYGHSCAGSKEEKDVEGDGKERYKIRRKSENFILYKNLK